MWNKLEEIPILKKGGIHIKKKNRGKFTEAANRAGMGVQEYANHVLANKDKYSSTLVKRANFARNSKKFKHENGGVLKVQEGTSNNTLNKIKKLITSAGKSITDSKIGAVGIDQIRDLYRAGKTKEAQDLIQKYSKTNTAGISLAGGIANMGLLGDLFVTGMTTMADSAIDGDFKNFKGNFIKNSLFDIAGNRVEKFIKPVGDLFDSSLFELVDDPGTIYMTKGTVKIFDKAPSKYASRILNGGSERTGISNNFGNIINSIEPTVLTRIDQFGNRLPMQDFRYWRKRDPDFLKGVPNNTITIPDRNTTVKESISDVFDIDSGNKANQDLYMKDLDRKLTNDEISTFVDHEASHLIDRQSGRSLGNVDFITGNYLANPTETHARITQVKDAAGIIDGSKTFTGDEYKKMFSDYIKSGQPDNNMSKFYLNVTDWNKLAKWANTFVPGMGTMVILKNTNNERK